MQKGIAYVYTVHPAYAYGRSIFGYRTQNAFMPRLCSYATTCVSCIFVYCDCYYYALLKRKRGREAERDTEIWRQLCGKWWTAIDKCKNQIVDCGIMKTTCNWTTIEIKYQNNLKISVRLSWCYDKFCRWLVFRGLNGSCVFRVCAMCVYVCVCQRCACICVTTNGSTLRRLSRRHRRQQQDDFDRVNYFVDSTYERCYQDDANNDENWFLWIYYYTHMRAITYEANS